MSLDDITDDIEMQYLKREKCFNSSFLEDILYEINQKRKELVLFADEYSQDISNKQNDPFGYYFAKGFSLGNTLVTVGAKNTFKAITWPYRKFKELKKKYLDKAIDYLSDPKHREEHPWRYRFILGGTSAVFLGKLPADYQRYWAEKLGVNDTTFTKLDAGIAIGEKMGITLSVLLGLKYFIPEAAAQTISDIITHYTNLDVGIKGATYIWAGVNNLANGSRFTYALLTKNPVMSFDAIGLPIKAFQKINLEVKELLEQKKPYQNNYIDTCHNVNQNKDIPNIF